LTNHSHIHGVEYTYTTTAIILVTITERTSLTMNRLLLTVSWSVAN